MIYLLRPTVRLLALVLAGLVLSGCDDATDNEPASLPSPPATTSSPPVVPSITPATPPATTSSPPLEPSITPATPSLPPEAAPEQGGSYWAVYLAVAESANDPELAEALQSARQLGYRAGSGDINCEQGAREALGLASEGEYYTVSILFETQEQAQQFAEAYQPEVVGTANITAYCLD